MKMVSLFFRLLTYISGAAYRVDKRLLGSAIQFASQVGDVNINGVRPRIKIEFPNMVGMEVGDFDENLFYWLF